MFQCIPSLDISAEPSLFTSSVTILLLSPWDFTEDLLLS